MSSRCRLAPGQPAVLEQQVAIALDTGDTRLLLQEVPAAYRAQISDVLLAALALAFARFTGTRPLWVDLEGHGRTDRFDGIDLSRTVGWFTAVYPVRLALPEAGSLGDALRTVRDTLRQVPGQGVGFGVLRYLSSSRRPRRCARCRRRGLVQLSRAGRHRGLGLVRLLRRRDRPDPGDHRSAQPCARDQRHGRARPAPAVVSYSDTLHDRATIEALAGDYLEALRALIAHRASADAARHTPADFPLTRLTQAEVDRVARSAR